VEDEGGRGLPQRDERELLGTRDIFKEQRGVGAKALPHDGRSLDCGETKPTTFKSLTARAATFVQQPCSNPSKYPETMRNVL
jgi:hypothetical protein